MRSLKTKFGDTIVHFRSQPDDNNLVRIRVGDNYLFVDRTGKPLAFTIPPDLSPELQTHILWAIGHYFTIGK